MDILGKTIVGMAIQITPENQDKIAIVNNGVVPQLEGFHTGSYFIYPYDPEIKPSIVPGYVFERNWAFCMIHTSEFFTEIVEI